MTDSEQEFIAPVIEPEEGESYMAAYERGLRERAGIAETDEPLGVLGVLTGQVPVRSMPIAMQPESTESE